MASTGNKKRHLMQTGIFRTENDAVSFLMASILSDSSTPVGAWTLKEELEKKGINYGTATIGRYLKELDSKGLTEQVSNLGRVLTEKGHLWQTEIADNVARAQMRNRSSNAMKIDSYTDLIDLIQARKAIEVAGVALAVEQATESDLRNLTQSVMAHYRCVAEKNDPTDCALDFHSVVAEISHNRFIKAMLDMLIFEERKLEESMEHLTTRERGKDYVVEHDNICSAIAERDSEKATHLMTIHLDALLDAVKEQIQEISEHEQLQEISVPNV